MHYVYFVYQYMMKLKYRIFLFAIIVFIAYIAINYLFNKHNPNLYLIKENSILNDNANNINSNTFLSRVGEKYIIEKTIENERNIMSNKSKTR